MFFGYDDFKEKVKKSKIELAEKYSYGLNLRKVMTWIFSGTMSLIIGILLIVESYIKKGISPALIVPILIVIFGAYFVSMIFNYKMIINIKEGKIVHKKAEIEINKIEKAVLKRMFSGNKMEICIDIITSDRIEMVIPLVMGNKLEFACVIKKVLGEKFFIE